MILLLLALISIVALSMYGINKELKWGYGFVSGYICPLFVTVGFVGLVIYAILVLSYVGAEHKANILNKEYGTNYTQTEVFYASSVIDTIRELDRKRIELNGDLLAGENK